MADPLDEAFAAYLRSCDEGGIDSREVFLAKYPELSGQLKELIDAADLIGNFTSREEGSSGDRPPSAHDQPDESAALVEPVSYIDGQNLQAADTLAAHIPDPGESGDGQAVTLPMPRRAKGDPGPTLPFDLGDYLLLEVIGRGGMGVVYLAKQSQLDRQVAVKMIRSGILAGETEVRRFEIEARAAARLHHPGIVSVYQVGERAGHHFFSMEYVRGTDLQKRINAGSLSFHDAARYVRDVALAIHHAHEKGVLHRDLKPANVLIDDSDQIHVTDFGLAKHLDCDSSVTGSGDAIGTPHYMAPEQAGGHSDRTNSQSDVYALGAILFAALTGRPPLVGDTVMQTLVKVIHDPAPAVRSLRPDVPIDLETIVAKCLEKKPGNRYPTAEKLANELNAFLEDRPIEARPRSRAMRAWHWFEGVPLVGALTGRRVLHSSDEHRRFQAAMLLLIFLTPIIATAMFTWWSQQKEVMPAAVRIAGGLEGGVYSDLSAELARRISKQFDVQTEIVPSNGSLDNRARLLDSQIDLAPMQATAISGDRLCVVAPLFYEVLHVLARTDSDIQTVTDLAGQRVAVGPEGSGSRATADLVFDSLGFPEGQIQREVLAWHRLNRDDCPEAAMICIGRGSPLVKNLLADGRWRLVPVPKGIEIALQHPTLRPMTIDVSDYPDYSISDGGIPTVGTTAFLAARDDTPSELVLAMLNALYAEPAPCSDLIPRRRAAEWQGLAFHRAARAFYRDK